MILFDFIVIITIMIMLLITTIIFFPFVYIIQYAYPYVALKIVDVIMCAIKTLENKIELFNKKIDSIAKK